MLKTKATIKTSMFLVWFHWNYRRVCVWVFVYSYQFFYEDIDFCVTMKYIILLYFCITLINTRCVHCGLFDFLTKGEFFFQSGNWIKNCKWMGDNNVWSDVCFSKVTWNKSIYNLCVPVQLISSTVCLYTW